jgi:mannopine transport system permease protein
LPALVMLGPLLVYMFVFYVVPFGNMTHESFLAWSGDDRPHIGLSTFQYKKTVQKSRTVKSLKRTFRISTIATVLTFLICFPITLLLLRVGPRVKAGILLVTFVSLASSLIIRNYGWLIVLADAGPINSILIWFGIIDFPKRMAYGEPAIIVALVHYCMPFMILPIYGSLLRIPDSNAEASLSLGANAWTTLRRIILPLSMPGIFGGTMLSFAICMSSYVTPLMLGSPSTAMVSQVAAEQIEVQLNFPWGSAIIVTLTLGSFLIVVVYAVLVRKVMRVDV